MKWTILCLCLGATLANAAYFPEKFPEKFPITKMEPGVAMSKDLLLKQKFFFDVFRNIHQPFMFKEYFPLPTTFCMDSSMYLDFNYVLDFMKMYDMGIILPKGKIFSIYNEDHMHMMTMLFNIFINTNDWIMFQQNVLFAREYLNEGMFVMALHMTVFHRSELIGIVLPPIYEIYPFYFFNADVMTMGMHKKMDGYVKMDTPYVIYANYTSMLSDMVMPYDSYKYNMMDFSTLMGGEEKLTYFTEDIGLNSYYYYWNIDYPFFMGGDKMNLIKDNRGELYLFFHQQLLARYYLERYGNDMGEIPEFSWDKPMTYGYFSLLKYYNGMQFPMRYFNYNADQGKFFKMIDMVKDYEMRIRNMIDSGFFYTFDGKMIDIRNPESIDILGNLIQANPDSLNTNFYRYVEYFARLLLGGSYHFTSDMYNMLPSVMQHFETSMRDPMFYMLYKRIVMYMIQFKSHLPYYTVKELGFDGVKIADVKFDKLMTYFDYFDSDISNGLDMMYFDYEGKDTSSMPSWKTSSKVPTWDMMIKARQMRLNHKPFGYNMMIKSDFAGKGVVRMFIGPKFLNLWQFDDYRMYFWLVDTYYTDLIIGDNIIKRFSKDFFWSVKDRTTYSDLYKNMMMAIDGKGDFFYDMSEAHCGFPDRLILPKGKFGGMPFTFYFIVTPYTSTKKIETDMKFTCGIGSGMNYFDSFAMGYPLDRPIDFMYFMMPNMYFKDVMIYHMDMEMDMNATHDMSYSKPSYPSEYVAPQEYKEYKPYKPDYYYKKPVYTKY